jgi:cobalamin biosynthesis Mg chelatase CobN
MDPTSEDTAVQDFLEILEEHRKNCERQGKYVEAEISKNRLEELRLHEENRRREAMRSRQIAERLGVEEAHMLEFQQFNMIWDNKMADYETHAEELVEAMKDRHGGELRDFQRKLMGKQIRPKFSRDLLNLRKIQDTLAKQKE